MNRYDYDRYIHWRFFEMTHSFCPELEARLVRYCAVETTSDEGASTVPSTATQLDLQRMLKDAKERKFDVVVTEALDRIGALYGIEDTIRGLPPDERRRIRRERAASLLAVRAAEQAFPEATHFYMLSGDCMPIKTAAFIHDRLDQEDIDHIESFDFFDSGWIKTGIKEERLVYRHYFNERTQKWLYYRSFWLQRWLGLKRAIPTDLRVMIGSQWWCLRRRTIEAVLEFCDKRPDVVRFFRTTWIPDETFFQTIVRHLVPSGEIRTRPLTFLMFTDYGMPVTFYNDHYDLLLTQDYFFARKISAEATDLKARLSDLYGQTDVEFDVTNEGRALHAFLTGRGRVGRRFAPRMWEAGMRELTLQRRLGHASPESTRIYTRVSDATVLAEYRLAMGLKP